MTNVLRGNLVPLCGVSETRDQIADVAVMTVYIATVALTATLHVYFK